MPSSQSNRSTSPAPPGKRTRSATPTPLKSYTETNGSRRNSSSVVRTSHELADEESPLLAPRTSEDETASLKDLSPLSDDDWQDGRQEETKSSWYLILLTLTGIGFQMSWSVEMAYGSPYLLSLGVSKSILALVWIAAPLTGMIVVPYVGAVSDRTRSRFGKRRPYIIGGAIATLFSLLLLSWAKEVISGFLGIFGANPESKGVKTCIIIFAVVMVYVLDISINTMQAGIRAIITDCTPTHQQDKANAWFARSTGMGNIIGYLAGFVNLPKYLPFLGYSQFKVLSAITCIALALTVTISTGSISERDSRSERVSDDNTVLGSIKPLFRSVTRLPPQVRRVCYVQLAAWIGWFPFLFYTTTYLGEVYADPFFRENPNLTDDEIDKIMEKATRVATLALFIFALTTFASAVVLPNFIRPAFKVPKPTAPTAMQPATPSSSSHSQSSTYFSSRPSPLSGPLSLWQRLSGAVANLRSKSLSLRRAWFLSHLLFSTLMWLTLFTNTITSATILIGFIGVPWALTQWAPFALISAEVSKRDAIRRGLLRAPATRDGQLLAHGEDDSSDQAGVVLGIHNVAIAAPQIFATLVSSAIFKALQKPRGTPGDDSVAWVLRFGGTCTLLAAYLTTRVADGDEDVPDEVD